LSLDAQQAKLIAYAALYEFDLVAVEVDAGVSAKILQRPGLAVRTAQFLVATRRCTLWRV
jgi:predicted DNA-binding helix-hairpin-helix protein